MAVATLECSHCGDVAVESDAAGLFSEDMVDCCMSCGMPGHVDIDETVDCDNEGADGLASWCTDDEEDNRCTRPDCKECHPPPPATGEHDGHQQQS